MRMFKGCQLQLVASFACLFVTLMSISARGQSNQATVLGQVTDSSGARIATYNVRLRNEATNVTIASNIAGGKDYVLPNIEPGTYELAVNATGFSSVVVKHIVVDVGQTVRHDIVLNVGSANTVVNVTAEEPLVQTDSSYVGDVIESKQIEQMPLNGRTNIFGLLALAPGVQNAGTHARIAGSDYAGGTVATFDGVYDMEAENAKLSSVDPSLDSIAEFKVVDSTGSAEYGVGTQQIIISSKQGSNTLHGGLFEYNRITELAATNYFSTTKTPYTRNEFGGFLGGPIKTDKLFYFGSFEELRFDNNSTSLTQQPTKALVDGNFSGLAPVIDPETGTPFHNNQIPISRFSSVASQLLNYFVTANVQTTQPGGLGTNYSVNLPNSERNFRYLGRIDYTITPKDSIFGRYYYVTDTTQSAGSTPLSGATDAPFNIQSLALNYTRILSPVATNLLTFGWELETDANRSQHPNLDTSFIPGLPPNYPGLSGLPTVSIIGFTGLNEDVGSDDNIPTYQLNDIFTWIRNKHTIKAGFSFAHYGFENRQSPSPSHGSFAFTGQYTGNAFADFLLGDLSTSAAPLNPVEGEPANDRYGFFVQDDWRVSEKLTINAGLRYDLPTLYQNVIGGMVNYYPNLESLVVLKGTYDPNAYPDLPIIPGSSVGLNPGNYIGNDHLQFAPRLGFAFRPLESGKFIVRGGYGLYYNIQPWQFGSFLLATNPPFSGVQTFEPAAGLTPTLSLDNPFPAGSGSTPSGITVGGLPTHYSYPETNQWNLTIESQVRPDLAFRATYLGSEQAHATYLDPINTPPQAPGPIQPRRPVPAFGDIQLVTNGSTSNTQMLQLAVTRRFASGLSFDGQYAWTKQLNCFPNGGYFSEPTDPQNIGYDRGNDPNIRQQYFIGNYVYDLPFGNGRRFLGNLSRPMELLIGGWETTGIVTLGSGKPYSVTFDSPLEGWYSSRADIVGDPHVSNPSQAEWFNTAAFQLPAPYTYGNSGARFLFGPGYTNWDVAFMKNFVIKDKYNLQFRAEMFNALNHPNFGNPNSDISVSSVGTITNTASSARVVQFAGRFTF
jgi:hypothetical protein